MVYLAVDYDNVPVAGVLAASEIGAKAYSQGLGITYHRLKVISPTALENHPTGVIPLFLTYEARPELREIVRIIQKP